MLTKSSSLEMGVLNALELSTQNSSMKNYDLRFNENRPAIYPGYKAIFRVSFRKVTPGGT